MKAQIEERLNQLRAEFAAGQELLAELERRQENVRQRLLRMSGAIQVLEELLQPEPVPAGDKTLAADVEKLVVE